MISCSFCGKKQSDVEQLVAGKKGENRSYICNECIGVSYEIVTKSVKLTDNRNVSCEKVTPKEIKNHLDKYVIGQETAKTILSVAVYNHFKRLHASDTDQVLDKSNILMAGPSGVGKTHLVKTIANYLDLPFAITDATSLTEAGYVGDDVENIIERLIQSADGDIKKAQQGIIYIDEIDKKVSKVVGGSANRDVSGEGVQQSLLKMVEGTVVKLSKKTGNPFSETIEFDTTNVLFIVGGAFVGIENVIHKDMNYGTSIGFSATHDKTVDDALANLRPKHLIDYGMIPEFVGRFPIVVPLHSLNKEMLIRILREPKGNLIDQFKLNFDLDGVKLSFSDEYIEYVADECIKNHTGARGLRSVLENSLLGVQFDLPDLPGQNVAEIYVKNKSDIVRIPADEKKQQEL